MTNIRDKYKMFRNYMTNELGISRSDIEAWTKEAVSTEVNKRLNGIDFEAVVQREVKFTARESIFGSYRSTGSSELRKAIAAELADQITVSIVKQD
jgi:hypothetical protein